MNYFLLPGNPPAAHFYRVWADEIRAHDPETRVGIAEYPLFAIEMDSVEYFAQLADVVAAQLDAFRERNSGPVALVGHSLGGYLALKVLERRNDDVARCFLLHPFLRQPDFSGRSILRLLHDMRRLPAIETWLIRAQPLVGRFMPEALALTHDEIRVFMQLVYHEHRVIARDRTPYVLSPELQAKVRVYSTPGDMWCPPSTVRCLGDAIPHVSGPASHRFIVNRAERDELHAFLRA